ncbi:hypothetical protein ACJRO7_002528 [Eucalyptus globulus]|uniref:Uncharacterized protein n=1 Tax=Eucalyptus globulus TaxID=34317 RepID=A0ABD3LYA7_EUCGL
MKRRAPSVVTTTSAAVAPRPRPPSSHRRSSPIPKPWKESRIATSASTSTTTTTTRRRSARKLAALQQFLREQNQNQNQSPADQSEVALVTEDWRLSQFWYDRETAETVADEVLALCSGTPSRVACIACPTLYAYLKLTRSLRSVLLLLHVIAKDHLILPFGCSYLTPRAKCDDHFKVQ